MLADKAVAAGRRAALVAARRGCGPAPRTDEGEPVPMQVTTPVSEIPANIDVQAGPEHGAVRIELAEPAVVESSMQPSPDPAECFPPRLKIRPKVLDRAIFRTGPEPATAPHLLRVLLSTVLATEERRPICIVLPSTEQVPETLALLASIDCLAMDLPRTREQFLRDLKPGLKVRLHPNGEVFEIAAVGADGSLNLLMTDKPTYQSHGTRYAVGERAFWFEPTTRQQPLGTQYTKFNRPALNQLDLLVGSQVFGNSGLVRTRILLAGARTEFERVVAALPVASTEAPAAAPVRSFFQFGGVDEAGTPHVIEPSGGAGAPMVAIERDLLDLERACLGAEVEPGSRVLITDRLDTVTKDLDLAGRIAERQRLVLLVDACRRAEVDQLASSGWTVWEPSPHEILGPGQTASSIGCSGLDASLRGAAAEILRSPGFISCKAGHLKAADAALASLGRFLGDESVEHESWVEDLLSDAQHMFFSSAGWLAAPAGEPLDAAMQTLARIRKTADRVESHLGLEAAVTLLEMTDALEAFGLLAAPGTMTAKGSEILRLARTASQGSFRQVFVTGNRQSREDADAFFRGQDLQTRCVAVRELAEVRDAASVVAFSVMRRNLFERLVDPWPASSTLFVGYDFENECYRRRLGRRQAGRQRLRLHDNARTRLTGFRGTSFPEPDYAPSAEGLEQADVIHLAGFDQATREWSWTRRITVPAPRAGEETCRARIVRFSGRSWCAMTDEHEAILIARDGRGASSIREAHVAELVPGSRIVVREGGDRDVIRLLAEGIKGEAGYLRLRQKAGLWRRVLREATTDMATARKTLEAVGVHRNPVTIRAWLCRESLIGPRSQDDLYAIARAFGTSAVKPADWQACSDAIREVRALHQTAGARLTETLAARCGKMLLEPSDTELAIDLGVGTVWVLEVASVEEEARECPSTYANRLHWQDTAWKLGLLASQLRAEAA